MFDLVIRNGAVIDGTGAPQRMADVAISDGRIAAIGVGLGAGAREIDASGQVVCPGFVDVHTHLDAQVFWDPQLTPSCFHGVTTVVAGNCGFSIAPLNPDSAAYLLPMLSRVEGMPVESLKLGVPWNWRSFADYLAAIEGKVGLNIGFMAGHSAIRRYVMGERAVGSQATPEELARLCEVLDRCLTEGALGLSTTNAPTHNDADGQPVPSRHAAREEFIALAQVCGRHEGTGLEIVPAVGHFTAETRSLIVEMSAAAKRTLNWNALNLNGDDDRIAGQLAASDEAAAAGAEVIALTVAAPMDLRINLLSGFIFDAFEGWEQVFQVPPPARIELLKDPKLRRELDRRARAGGPLAGLARWEDFIVSTCPDASMVGRRIGDLAAEREVEPIDAMLDLAIANDLMTSFLLKGSGDDDETWRRRGEMWRDPRCVIGASDAGAHLDMIDQFAYTTVVLGEGVRRRGLLTLEEAVHCLTQAPAELIGLRERGVLRAGWCADVVIFDPATVAQKPVEARHDLPGGQMRLYADAIGVNHVFVNGVQIVEEGRHTGTLPGQVLRSGRDTATRPIPALHQAAE